MKKLGGGVATCHTCKRSWRSQRGFELHVDTTSHQPVPEEYAAKVRAGVGLVG